MAYRLSFRRMTRSWKRLFARASAALGLLLVTPLVFAGLTCVSALGQEAPALRTASQDRCVSATAASDACIASAQRIDVRVAAASSPLPLAAPGVAEHAAAKFRTTAEVPLPIGLAPAPPAPVYILLRRYLS
ncbi:MAG: hypothetical protein ACREQZ_04180 [Woeseiaceae bacterium]